MKTYEMTENQLRDIMTACEPVPMIGINSPNYTSAQERANIAWEKLGSEMGFDHMTVVPTGEGDRFFKANSTSQKDAQIKTYVTFGFDHRHDICGEIYDQKCIAVITSESEEKGRALAFETFGREFCFETPEDHFNFDSMHNFPRGFIEVN